MTNEVIDVTVVFPYYNEASTLPKTLELISQQTTPPKEVIFVNSSSNDDSSKLLDDWIKENQPNFRTIFSNIYEGTNNPASSKNVGIRNAKTEWVAFMDCGLLFPVNWLECQWNFVNKHNLDVVSGVCFLSGKGLVDKCAIAQTYGYKRKRPVVPSTLIRKSVFERTGLFLENRRAGYDAEWPLELKRQGIPRGVNEEVIIQYNGVNFGNNLPFILKKCVIYAIPTVGLKNYKIPYYFLLLTIVGFIAYLAMPYSWPWFLLAYFFLRGIVIPVKKSKSFAIYKEHPQAIIFLPIVAFTMDLGRLVGILMGIYKYHIKNEQ